MSQAVSPDAPLPARPRWIGSPGVKLGLVGGLLLTMLVPTALVSSVVSEREDRQAEVRETIAQNWGQAQTVVGPVLIIPWQAWVPVRTSPNSPPEQVRGTIQVVPRSLVATVDLAPEQRRRGLFGAVVYEADVALAGSFVIPELSVPGHAGAELLWRDAAVAVGSSDLRGAADTVLTWDGTAKGGTEDVPMGEPCERLALMGWRLRAPDALAPGRTIPFATRFALRGTQGFRLAPSARDVTLAITAPWATPSFTGTSLPARSTVTDSGFSAGWSGGVGLRQAAWVSQGSGCGGAIATAAEQGSGVELLEAVPVYRMVNRASKYAVLFLALSFLTYLLFEMLARVRIHLVQYGLLGLSISLFGLLLLSIAEPLGFGAAYGVATAAVLAQATIYTATVTRRVGLAAVFGGVLAGCSGSCTWCCNRKATRCCPVRLRCSPSCRSSWRSRTGWTGPVGPGLDLLPTGVMRWRPDFAVYPVRPVVFRTTAARMSLFSASPPIVAPSWRSIARLMLQRLVLAAVDSIGLLGSIGAYPYDTRAERRRATEAAVSTSRR